MPEKSYKINGIDLYTFTNPHLNSFCISLYVKAGCMFETETDNGITHLLEHCLYRNLKNSFGGKLYELTAQHGLDMSASTYKNFIRFSVDGLNSGFEFASDLILKLFSEINFSKVDFSCEKERIRAEMLEKAERTTLDYVFDRYVWDGTCLEKTILGCYSKIKRISLKKLNEYRNSIFSAGNVFIYVTGNITDDDIGILKEKLAELNVNQNGANYDLKVRDTGSFFNRKQTIIVKQNSWNYIKIGFDVEMQKYKSGVYDLIFAILFKGDKALMYNSMSEDNPIIYSYDSDYEQYDDISNINFKFEVAEDKIEEALALVIKTLDDLKNGRFNFEANYQCELASWIVVQDNVDDFNFCLAFNNHILRHNDVDYSKKHLGRLDGITKETVIMAAKEIFRTKNMTVAMKGNKRKINVQRLNEILGGLDK